MSAFEVLNRINVNDKTEEKNGLTYLSWAWAWGEIKKAYPGAVYTIYERQTDYGPVNYFTDGRTCWVKTGMTIEGQEHIEMLPVMDFRNNSIPLERVTSTDVNKAIQRSLTKAAARHGLGLYIYAGEDLPEEEAVKQEERKPRKPIQPSTPATVNKVSPVKNYVANEINEMKEMFGVAETGAMLSKFGQMRQTLINEGIIPDIPSDQQTMEQAQQMIAAIYEHFTPGGKRA